MLFFSGAFELAVRLLRSYSGLNSSVCWWQIRLTHAHGEARMMLRYLFLALLAKLGNIAINSNTVLLCFVKAFQVSLCQLHVVR